MPSEGEFSSPAVSTAAGSICQLVSLHLRRRTGVKLEGCDTKQGEESESWHCHQASLPCKTVTVPRPPPRAPSGARHAWTEGGLTSVTRFPTHLLSERDRSGQDLASRDFLYCPSDRNVGEGTLKSPKHSPMPCDIHVLLRLHRLCSLLVRGHQTALEQSQRPRCSRRAALQREINHLTGRAQRSCPRATGI